MKIGNPSPCSTDITLKRFFPRVDSPVIVQLQMARKVLSTQLALPRSLNPVHGTLVDGKGVVVVDDDLAEGAADGGLGLGLVLLLLHLVLTGVGHVVDPLVFQEKRLRNHFY